MKNFLNLIRHWRLLATLGVLFPSGAYAEPLPALEQGEYTVVVIPDTQSYTGKGTKKTPDSEEPVRNDYLGRQVKWILEHQKDENIVFVTHVGDIVDKNVPEQWEVAKGHLGKLIGKVPCSFTVGNHDMKGSGDSTLFQKYFGAENFKQFDWYIDTFEGKPEAPQFSGNNANSAHWIRFGDQKVLHLNLECNAPDSVLKWAGEVVAKYPGSKLWITTHMDLGIIEKPKSHEEHIHGVKGRMKWHKNHGKDGNSPQNLWDRFYTTQKNLDLILSGDQSRVTALRTTQINEAGKTVHALLSDYQSQPILRVMRYHPEKKRLRVHTLNLRDSQLVESTEYVSDRSQHQFELSFK